MSYGGIDTGSERAASEGRAYPVVRPTPETARPFALLAALGVLCAAAPPYHAELQTHVWRLVALAALLPVLGWLFAQILRRDRRTWVDPAGPWLAFGAVFLLRDVAGGSGSGLGALIGLPVFWLVLFGTRRDLVVASVLAAATLLLPLWLLGAPDYPLADWRRALMWTAVVTVVAPALRPVAARFSGAPPGDRHGGAESDRQQELAARLAGVLRGAPLTGLVTTDVHGQIESFGVGAERQWGCRESEMVGRSLTELMHDPIEMDEVAAELGAEPGFPVLAELARRREPGRRWVCRRKDGDPMVVRLALTELRGGDSVPTGYLAVTLDETDAVRTQQELTQSEARWRVLMDHLPDTVVVLVEQGAGIKVVTGGGLLGRRLRDSAGRWLQDLASEAGVPIGKMLEGAFAGAEQGTVDASLDGRDHEVMVSPLPTTKGRPHALVLLRDVSKDRQRQRAITAAKERAERLFEDAPQGIALLTPEGEALQVNPALSRLFGRDDLAGQPLASLSFRPGDATVSRHLQALLCSGNGQAVAQWSVRAADRSEGHVVLTSTLLRGGGGDADVVLTNVVDVSERHRYEQQLMHLADHDPLTGLANRRRFNSELNRHVEECRRYGVRGALLVLDLDHFKEVNDSLGHAVGDDLLNALSDVLRDRLRGTDVVARLGGDEFAVLLPHADRKAAEQVAQNIVQAVHAHTAGLADTRRDVTVSIGGVVVDSEALTASDLLSSADAAMYAAKAAGRDQYVIFG